MQLQLGQDQDGLFWFLQLNLRLGTKNSTIRVEV